MSTAGATSRRRIGSRAQDRRRRGGSIAIIIGALALFMMLGLGLLLSTGGSGRGPGPTGSDLFTVRRGSFDVVIPASGELAALRQIEIRNKLDTRAAITYIVDEGRTIKAGEVLLRLADEDIRNKIKDADDAVKTAEAALVAAQATLAIKTSASESDIDKAQLQVELAQIALKVWQDGEVVSKRRKLAIDIETARKDSDRLADRYKESVKLFDQKFISLDELKRDEIAMIQAAAKLEQANLDQEVYEKYQYEQDRKKMESDVDQAVAERQRVEQRHAAELQTARADVTSKTHQFASTGDRLQTLQQQLSYCVIAAPSDGLVVYASSMQTNGWGRNEGQPPMVGTELQANELVMILPDTSQIVANIKVNESLTGLISPGQRVAVASDALPDVVLPGEVLSIGVLAETGGWRDPNRRDYTVRVLLDGENSRGLKPSMRARAEIAVGRVTDGLYVPVQAVFRNGPLAYVYVPQDGGYSQREVTTGQASELYMQIIAGLQEQEVVLLREPAPREVVARLTKEDSPADGQAPTDAGADQAAGARAARQAADGDREGRGPGRRGPRPG